MAGAMPDAVREKWDLAVKGKPRDRAAVINACVPKDVSYGDVLKVNPEKLSRIAHMFKEQKTIVKLSGRTWTSLAQEWGHGDESKGGEAIARALKRGDLKEKDGLYFDRSQIMSWEQKKGTTWETWDDCKKEDYSC